MLLRTFALFCLLSGCASSHAAIDAPTADAFSSDPDAAAVDAGIVCTTLSRPTGSCDPARGACCEASTHCERGYCRYPGWVCSGDLGYCIDRLDCCNSRHSCIGNACMY